MSYIEVGGGYVSIWIILIIAISLSMDAFSLSLAYGTLNLKKKDTKLLSFIVGVYHFIMPLIGILFGTFLFKVFDVNPNWIVFIVLFFIGCQMFIESFKDQENVKRMTKLEMLLFGLAVSIDSFSVGIGLKSMTTHYLLCASLFSFFSFSFTYLGLRIGSKVYQKLGVIATTIGGVVLMIIGFLYLL